MSDRFAAHVIGSANRIGLAPRATWRQPDDDRDPEHRALWWVGVDSRCNQIVEAGLTSSVTQPVDRPTTTLITKLLTNQLA